MLPYPSVRIPLGVCVWSQQSWNIVENLKLNEPSLLRRLLSVGSSWQGWERGERRGQLPGFRSKMRVSYVQAAGWRKSISDYEIVGKFASRWQDYRTLFRILDYITTTQKAISQFYCSCRTSWKQKCTEHNLTKKVIFYKMTRVLSSQHFRWSESVTYCSTVHHSWLKNNMGVVKIPWKQGAKWPWERELNGMTVIKYCIKLKASRFTQICTLVWLSFLGCPSHGFGRKKRP